MTLCLTCLNDVLDFAFDVVEEIVLDVLGVPGVPDDCA